MVVTGTSVALFDKSKKRLEALNPHFLKYLVSSGVKYRTKGLAASRNGEGPSTNPFWDL